MEQFEIFCSGYSIDDPGYAGSAAVIDKGELMDTFSAHFATKTSNAIAGLFAVIDGVEHVPPGSAVKIWSTSHFVVNSINDGLVTLLGEEGQDVIPPEQAVAWDRLFKAVDNLSCFTIEYCPPPGCRLMKKAVRSAKLEAKKAAFSFSYTAKSYSLEVQVGNN